MSATPAASGKSGGLFQNRFFQTIVVSNVLLQIGIWVRNFAILMFVADQTNNDPVSISLIQVVEFAPIFVFSFIGGTFADRWRPKRTIIWCDFLSAVSVFAVLITLLLESWETVYLVTFVSAILSQFSQPSVMKLFKQHIPAEQVQSAMAVFQSLTAIFMVLGPSLGVFAYQNFGIHWSIAVMGTAFLFSALVLFRLPADVVEEKKVMEKGQFWKEFSGGFQYVWRSKALRSLGAAFAIAGLSVGIGQSLGIFIVTERLGQPKEYLQFLLGVNGVAMLIGGALIVGLAKKWPPQKLLAFGMLVGAICTVGVGMSTSLPVTLVLQFINGLAFPAIQIGINTMILQWSEASYIGRVNGVLSPMFVGMNVIMMALAGPLKLTFPLVGIYATSGILMFFAMMVLVPTFRLRPEFKAEGSA